MNITNYATATAVIVSLSLVSAGPAFAEEGFNGVYRYDPEIGDIATVTVSSNCATDGCVAHIVGEKGNVQGDAILHGSQWILSVTNPVGDICEGNAYPADQVYTWDTTTLRGTLTSNYGPECDGTPGTVTTGFTLTKVS
ncbi:hypothetical protein BVU76_28380 [Mycolicibacterium porcinum]|nr:hypothetical protein BVU76_28380 [Mycolicibacterium porcinum]